MRLYNPRTEKEPNKGDHIKDTINMMITNKPKKNTRVSTQVNEDGTITVHLTTMLKTLPKPVKGLIRNKRGTTTLSFSISREAARSLADQLIFHKVNPKP